MKRADRDSWKRLPLPSLREDLKFAALFTEAEAEQIMCGLIPEQMEDKWFIYFSEGWLFFHRSWTGVCIYGLRLNSAPEGVRVVESWVIRDPEQYGQSDTAYDRELVRFLIDELLLQKNVSFPMPSDIGDAQAGIVQHMYTGRAYPEKPSGEIPEGNEE